jgi:hypothetical protein
MTSAARKIEPRFAYEEVARVVRVAGATCTVATEGGEYTARRAVSCLVQPEPDDEVLVAHSPDGDSYVLAILEREGGRESRLVFDGDVSVSAPNGRLAIAAAEGVEVASTKDVRVVSAGLQLTALTGRFFLDRLAFLGTAVTAELGHAKVHATTLETVAERLTQRLKRMYRFVEEFDQLRAARVDYAATKTMTLSAETAVMTAEQVVKVDGAQVHIG